MFLSCVPLKEVFNGASVLCDQIPDRQNTGQHKSLLKQKVRQVLLRNGVLTSFDQAAAVFLPNFAFVLQPSIGNKKKRHFP